MATHAQAIAAEVFVVSVGGAFGAGFSLGSDPERATTSGRSDGPRFLPAYGWNVVQTGLTVPPEGPSTIAANVQFSPRDLAIGGRPTETIKSLGPDGILLYAMLARSPLSIASSPSARFRFDLRMQTSCVRLQRAQRQMRETHPGYLESAEALPCACHAGCARGRRSGGSKRRVERRPDNVLRVVGQGAS